jgi:sulfopyruvate decarboxylase TPP-binding subunit
MGGKEPMVLIQSTGFFESGDAVRGVGLDLRQPLLMMIGYRGYSPNGNPTDSAAVFLEPMLKAWGITYHLLRTEGDLGCIVKAHREAHQRERPVAVLVCGEYT